MERRLPIYLHQPLQILWFDSHEMTIIVLFYLQAALFGGAAWLLFAIGPTLLIPFKRSQARGWFSHIRYFYGLTSLRGYPLPTCNRFHE